MLPDKLLINLRILSKIQKNGKITKSTEGIIHLESSAFLKSIKRFFNNDNRKQSIFEINSIIDETNITLNHLINNKHMQKNHNSSSEIGLKREKSEYINTFDVIKILLHELNKSRYGIENLKFTYKSDQNIISQIDIILLKVNSIIKNVTYKLEELGITEIQIYESDNLELNMISI